MIRVPDPAQLGAVLDEVRQMHGAARMDFARDVAARSGRELEAVRTQLWAWSIGKTTPTVTSLGPVLDALGYDLALVPREEA